jgi:hypothetical protein
VDELESSMPTVRSAQGSDDRSRGVLAAASRRGGEVQ